MVRLSRCYSSCCDKHMYIANFINTNRIIPSDHLYLPIWNLDFVHVPLHTNSLPDEQWSHRIITTILSKSPNLMTALHYILLRKGSLCYHLSALTVQGNPLLLVNVGLCSNTIRTWCRNEYFIYLTNVCFILLNKYSSKWQFCFIVGVIHKH